MTKDLDHLKKMMFFKETIFYVYNFLLVIYFFVFLLFPFVVKNSLSSNLWSPMIKPHSISVHLLFPVDQEVEIWGWGEGSAVNTEKTDTKSPDNPSCVYTQIAT